MAKRVFDTSYLIGHWHDWPRTRPSTTDDMRLWAEKLVKMYDSRWIVTPVYIEMVAGVSSAGELKLTRAYLASFEIVDGGKIPQGDWDEARNLAQRVGPKGGKRQLGDCLVRAVAKRLNCEVLTWDRGFPRAQ